jgi:hypothetical protein
MKLVKIIFVSMGTKPKPVIPVVEVLAVAFVSLGLYLPFLSIQYDTNGLIEAMAVENGPVLNKNHILFRPLGLLAWRASHLAGYTGNSLHVLQTISAVAGAFGIGFAFLAFRRLSVSRASAYAGTAFLATSFTYWVSATDVFYISVAAMFAAAAFACVVHAESHRAMLVAGILVALSIFTWQGSIFLMPALILMFPKRWRTSQSMVLFVASAGLMTTLAYGVLGFHEHGWMGPRQFWTWFTHYSENATLPIWGRWQSGRVSQAALSALDSLTAARLAVGIRELHKPVQLGRVAVDCSIIALTSLIIIAAWKRRLASLPPVLGYLCFFPFIVWWDPGSDKWFLIPNIFLAAFLVCSFSPMPPRKSTQLSILLCLLTIAGTNFITTIRPRHFDRGPARRVAECVAAHMHAQDMFVAAEWGWPDYLPYVHDRTVVNVINEFAQFQNKGDTIKYVKEAIAERLREGGRVFIADPLTFQQSDSGWLEQTTAITPKDLSSLGGTASFACYNRTIDRIDAQ